MRANEIKRRWQAGEACVNGWCAIPNSFSADTTSPKMMLPVITLNTGVNAK